MILTRHNRATFSISAFVDPEMKEARAGFVDEGSKKWKGGIDHDQMLFNMY